MVNCPLLFIPVLSSIFSGENQLNTELMRDISVIAEAGNFHCLVPLTLSSNSCTAQCELESLWLKSLRKGTLTVFWMSPLFLCSNLRLKYLKQIQTYRHCQAFRNCCKYM